jgi:hypothetical protein
MRTVLRLGACAAILTAFSTTAHAQSIFDRIKKKAEDIATQKAEEKITGKISEVAQKMVDNSFSSMFGDSAGGAAGAKGGRGGGGLPFSINSNAKTEASYSFNVVTTMEIESSRQKEKAVLTTLYNSSEPYVGMKIVSPDDKKSSGAAFIVMDAKNQAMVMLMSNDTSKFSFAYGWSDAQKYAAPEMASKEQVNWDTVKVWRNYTRIGTKTIAGYAADGYRMESPDGTAEVWVSHDRALAGGGMFGASSQLKQMRGRLPAEYPQGMLMQLTSVNSKTGEKASMTVTNIETNAHVTYAMSDYPRLGIAKK